MTGEKLTLFSLNGLTSFEVVIKWHEVSKLSVSSEDDEKWLCLEILKLLELGFLLHCPKFVDETPENGYGTRFDRTNFTRLSEFKKPAEGIPGDIRNLTSIIPNCSSETAESAMKCIGKLHEEKKLRAPYGASDVKVVYVAESLAVLLPDTFNWTNLLEREGAILDANDALFAKGLEVEMRIGLWTSQDMANMKGQYSENAAELIRMENAKDQDRCWQQVFQSHPYASIANGQHGKRVICGLRDQRVWAIIEKLGRALIVTATSPFLNAILQAGPDSGVSADGIIRHDDLIFSPAEIEEFAETLAREMTKTGGFALVKQPPGLGPRDITHCSATDQLDRQERCTLPQLPDDERFSRSRLLFLALHHLEGMDRAKIVSLPDGFGVVTATVVGNARPSPSFTIQEEFGNQLDETFLDRSFRSKFGKKEPTRQSLDSIRRTIFFKKVETCIIHPLLMRGWTIDSQDDSQVQLRAGETDTSQSLRSEGLDAELVIRHPWYTTEEGTDTIGALITEEKIWTRQLKSGVLCLKDASGLDGWHQNEPRLHSWDPLKDSIDDLLQQEATAAEERPAQGGSTPNDAKETDFEMPESVTAGTESTSVVVGKTASMMYDGAVAGAASGTNTDAESMICDIDKEADTEYGAGAGAASGTAGSGDKTASMMYVGAVAGAASGTDTDAGTRATEKRTAEYRVGLSEQCFQMQISHIFASSERGFEISNTQAGDSGVRNDLEWVPEMGDHEPTITMTLGSEETVSYLLYAGRSVGNNFNRVILRYEDDQEQTVSLEASGQLHNYKLQPISTSQLTLTFQTDSPLEGQAGAQVIELWIDPAAGKVGKKIRRQIRKK